MHSLQAFMLNADALSKSVNFIFPKGKLGFKLRITICLSFLQLLQLTGNIKVCEILYDLAV